MSEGILIYPDDDLEEEKGLDWTHVKITLQELHLIGKDLSTISNFLKLDVIRDGVVLAGGALQTIFNPIIEINDYDVFFTNSEQIEPVRRTLEGKNFDCTFACPAGHLYTYKNNITGMKVQLITKFIYNSKEHVISEFDIMAGCIVYDGFEILAYQQAIEDCEKMVVHFNCITYPISTINRLGKYKWNKGFYVPEDTYILLFNEIKNKNFNLENMMLYVD